MPVANVRLLGEKESLLAIRKVGNRLTLKENFSESTEETYCVRALLDNYFICVFSILKFT